MQIIRNREQPSVIFTYLTKIKVFNSIKFAIYIVRWWKWGREESSIIFPLLHKVAKENQLFEMQFKKLHCETNFLFFFFFYCCSHWHVEAATLNAHPQHWSHVHKKWGFPWAIEWSGTTPVKWKTAVDGQKDSAWPKKSKTHTFCFSDQCESLLKKKKRKKLATDKKGDVQFCF